MQDSGWRRNKKTGGWFNVNSISDSGNSGITTNEYMNNKIKQGAGKTNAEPKGFEESKFRNEKGELLELYHGSPNDFETFSEEKFKTGATMYASSGQGFYFTDSQKKASEYSKNGYKYSVYLNSKKPFVVENKITSEANEVLTGFSKKVLKEHPEINEKMFGTYEIFNKNNVGQRSGTAILSNVVVEYGKEFTNYLKQKGYDGIKSSVSDYKNLGENYNYVVFNSSQIKIIKKEK